MTSEKKSKIAIPSSVILNGNAYAIAIVGLAQALFRMDKGNVLAVPELFAEAMDISTPLRKNKKKAILDAFEELYILNYFEKHNAKYYIKTDIFYKFAEGFTLIDMDVFLKLASKPNLLFHYILIFRGLIDGVCKFSLNYFAKNEGVSKQTISHRTKELQNMELIYVIQSAYDPESGTYGNNLYYLFDPARNFVKEENYTNLNRKVSQRYNAFIQNSDNFSPLEIKGLRKQVEEYNTRNPERQKDLTVFDL